MKSLAVILFIAMTLASSQAADSPKTDFPKVGETYRIQTATPLVESPYDSKVTIVSVGEHQWAKVQYEKAKRGADGKQAMEILEMWVNFAHVTSAVKATAGSK